MIASPNRLRLLLAIASYGNRNIELLKRIIAKYRGMQMDVDIIVLSEAPKNLGPDVKVVVGLPSKNPWSLPFGHKKIFAENADRYDLFAYTEDDMEVTEENIQAFLRITPALERDEIAGFLRYETDSSGNKSVPEAHGSSHWKPETVKRRGEFVVAEFSNEHAAFFILTRSQIKTAIASGGFLREPYVGRYDMLCSAATDPYTSCGFRKVIAISHLDSFLIHHLSNRYAGKLGSSLAAFEEQVRTLSEIEQGAQTPATLCNVESEEFGFRWAKSYYEKPMERLLAIVPQQTKTVLSIGCGWGETEVALMHRGAEVTALPLDSVIGADAARRGIKVVCGPLRKCLKNFRGRKFQCIVLTNLLHLQKDPCSLIEECSALLEDKGALVMAGPNFELLPVFLKRLLGSGDYRKLRNFDSGGINAFSATAMTKWMRENGLKIEELTWSNTNEHSDVSGALGSWQKFRSGLSRKIFHNGKSRFTSDSWIVRGRK
jgi:2-polyprenyl-3-methyl-5-hydroxy-6-metoxy-1,4-benzoquinol methylase